jgi:hypothetical protein
MKEEKQTDVNIAVKMFEMVEGYDKLILLTADSDQVPSVRLLLGMHKEKKIYVLPPIGRNSKELVKAAGKNRLVMTEDHLKLSLLPNPVEYVNSEGESSNSGSRRLGYKFRAFGAKWVYSAFFTTYC